MIVYKLYYKDFIYVGVTKDLRRRLRNHKKEALHSSKLLYKTMREQGINNFKIEKIKAYSTHEDARIGEKYYIEEIANLNTNVNKPSNKVVKEKIKELEEQIEVLKQLL